MFPDMSDGDVFFRIQLLWGVAPPMLLILCVATWLLISKCKHIEALEIKIKTSCVALLYLVWPSLCSQTFSLFACRSICSDATTFLRADLDVSCWEGVHGHYAFVLGLPMLFLYVIGLPVAALLRVRSMHLMTVVNEDDEKIYGMFYTAFRPETWWWEGTVAGRKIIIALIGVFGTNLEDMQVHLTLMLVVFILLVTSQVRPFGGLKHGVLHVLEMASLMVSSCARVLCFLFRCSRLFLVSPPGHVFNVVGGVRVQHPSKMRRSIEGRRFNVGVVRCFVHHGGVGGHCCPCCDWGLLCVHESQSDADRGRGGKCGGSGQQCQTETFVVS